MGSRSPDFWDQIPRWAGGWACTSHPGVLGSFPKREEPGKTGRPADPVLKYRVPHGSLRSLVRDGQTSSHRPWLVVSRSTCPPLSPSPHANSLIKGNAVINTHIPCWGWVLSSRWTYYLTQLVKLSPSTSKRSRYKHRKCKFTSVYYITWLTEKRFGSRNFEFVFQLGTSCMEVDYSVIPPSVLSRSHTLQYPVTGARKRS